MLPFTGAQGQLDINKYGLKGEQDLGRSGDRGDIQHEEQRMLQGAWPSMTCCDFCVARNKYGMMTQVTQTLKLEDTPKINSRFFEEGKM